MYVISHFQAKDILDSYTLDEDQCSVSLDLGRSTVTIKREGNDYLLPDGQRIMVKLFTKILGDTKACYLIEDERVHKVQCFSDETNKFYKLYPTGKNTPPTVEISGIRMHVVKEMDPGSGAQKMIEQVLPVEGKVLDTCRGLGYTAIAAVEHGASEVICIEKDLTVTEVAKYNPYSKELFDNPKITLTTGDSFEVVQACGDEEFSRIVHDPPRLSLAGLLYSQEFYDQLFRILKKGGILYHYTGNPGEKKRGIDLPKNTIARLQKSGFVKVKRVHYGVRAIKP